MAKKRAAKVNPTRVKVGFPGMTAYEIQRLLAIEEEAEKRQIESLRLYEPLPFQEQYHACRNKELILAKGTQVGGPMPLSTPVLTPHGWCPIGGLSPGDQVIGGDGMPCNVTHVFVQGWLPIYKLTFEDGATVHCSADHHWRCKLRKSERFGLRRHDKWGVYSLREIMEHGGKEPQSHYRALIPKTVCHLPEKPVPLDPYTLGVLLGDGSISCDSVSFTTEDSEIAEHVSASVGEGAKVTTRSAKADAKARVYGVISATPTTTGKPSLVKQALKELELMGTLSQDKFIPECYLHNSVRVRLELLRGLMDTDGTCAPRGACQFFTCSQKLAVGVVNLVRSLGGKASVRWKETSIIDRKVKRGHPCSKKAKPARKQCLHMAVVVVVMDNLNPFKLSRKAARWGAKAHRKTDARSLWTIEPDGNAKCCCIKVDSPDHTFVVKDYIVTHNSLAGFVEVARAVTGQDPYNKYPKENGVAVCLGFGERHIGRVIHKYLFRAGGFRIIRDRKTKQWRVFRPWSPKLEVSGKPGDMGREEEARMSPPLIPKRYIEGKIAYQKRAEHIFSYVRFITGWELYALNSAGDPSQSQGYEVDLFHIDEDLATGGWYEEAVSRVTTRKGKIRWTAVPHSRTEDLIGMIQRADEEEEAGVPVEQRTSIKLTATMYDNPYQPEESKKQNEQLWRSLGEDVFRKRALGEVVLDSLLMYPTWSRSLHAAVNWESERDPLQAVLTETRGTIPQDWTRYMLVDPGHTICAVLFMATPPADVGDYRVAYDELYMRNCDKLMFGTAIEPKVKPYGFQEFIIDAHGGRLRELGSGILPKRQYEQEMERRGIESINRGSRFAAGSDDIPGREEKLREWLAYRQNLNGPVLHVVMENCPNLVREMGRFKKKLVRIGGQDVPTDEGNRRANSHLVECLEYAAAHGLPYVAPQRTAKLNHVVERIIEARKQRAAQRLAKYFDPRAGGRVLAPRGAV